MSWHEFFPTSWFRSDHAGAAMPHDEDGNVTGNYWLAWPPYITDDKEDPGSLEKVLRRRFKTREAAMAYVDKTWPLESESTDA
ncbi:hypothetical protein ACUN7Z_00615 [Vreelandella venusta]|uniref:hypothetical protein n=1 Tax=Vreelandella venusta TaxID=44935 RepID=UPI004044BA26